MRIGALGLHRFPPGYYLYAGSAFAAGGLRARVRRHCNGGRAHWHVDYLRARSTLLEVWWTDDPQARELAWAVALADWLADTPVPGFGASDSPLPSHLFFAPVRPAFAAFRRRLFDRHPGHAPLYRVAIG